jgi:hypothetical protein
MAADARRFALLADGRSDRVLLPILEWLLHRRSVRYAEPAFHARDPSNSLAAEMQEVIQLHRPHVLLVHRDAEGADAEVRRREVPSIDHPTIVVVPVRMTEAWLLFDETAIRAAADRPDGKNTLDLPVASRAESVADPKRVLHEALLAAADVTGRRRRKFKQDLPLRVMRLAALIEDWSPLRRLAAFTRFESDLCAVVPTDAP